MLVRRENKNRKKQIDVSCLACEKRHMSLFADVPDEVLQTLQFEKGCRMYAKGQDIFTEGDRPRGIFCINGGKIKVQQTGGPIRDQIMRFAKDGDVIGYRSLISGENYAASATAMTPSSVCFFPKEVIFKLIESDPRIALKLLNILSGDLKQAETMIAALAQKPVKDRLAEMLLYLGETYGYEKDKQTLCVRLSREELANFAGTSRETVIRVLTDLNATGVIELVGKGIRIVDRQRLVKIANVFD